jgi:hypothetical protein
MSDGIDTTRHEATLDALRNSPWATIVEPKPEAWLLTDLSIELARAALDSHPDSS